VAKDKYINEITLKHGDKAYRVQIKLGGRAKRKEISKQFRFNDFGGARTTLEVARLWRDKTLSEMRLRQIAVVFPTVEQLYYDKFNLFPVSLKTRENHDYFYKHAISEYAERKINKITSADIQVNVNKYAENHSQKMSGHLLSIWRQLFKVAIMRGYDVSDKTYGVVIPKNKEVKEERIVTISDEDFTKFMNALLEYNENTEQGRYNSYLIWYMLTIMFFTGMRPAEVLALTRKDITKTHIKVNKAVGSSKTQRKVIVPVKTKTSLRSVPIASELKPILDSLKAFAPDKKFLFTQEGELLEIDYVSNYISLVSKSCGIKFNAYMLRHKFSTELFNKNVNPRVIQDLMGHASSSMSLEYARSNEIDREEAINKLKND